MPVSTSIQNFNVISGYVYRACWMTEHLRVIGQITAPQAAAILTAWNGNIKSAGANAVNLPEAADRTQESLAVWWNTAGLQLKQRCLLFAEQLLATFPEQENNSHPCSNWGAVIQAFATTF